MPVEFTTKQYVFNKILMLTGIVQGSIGKLRLWVKKKEADFLLGYSAFRQIA